VQHDDQVRRIVVRQVDDVVEPAAGLAQLLLLRDTASSASDETRDSISTPAILGRAGFRRVAAIWPTPG
jgi:hypothetical protein